MIQDSHVARDLVQARLLGAIFSNSVRNEIALKGGFAMRVLTGSKRFTKDIDLAASPTIPTQIVQSYIRKAINDLRGTGMIQDLIISEPKQTDTTQRWKIGGKVGNHEINLTVEVSRRNRLEPSSIEKIPYQCMPGKNGAVPIACINLENMVTAKLDCLNSPIREAPRDIYDLFLMIKMDVKPTPEALKKYGAENIARLKDQLWAKLEKMDFPTAQQQLISFLPPDVAKTITADVWDEVRLEVGDRVTAWMIEAEKDLMENEDTDEQVAQFAL